MEKIIIAHIVLALGGLAYFALIRNAAWYKMNRAVLLTLPLLAIGGAFLEFKTTSAPVNPVYLDAVVTEASTQAEAASNAQSSGWGLLEVYALIAAFLLMVGLVKLAYSWWLIKNNRVKGSFAFFNRVFVDQNLDGLHREVVHFHEQVHTKHGHTIDLLVFELYRAVFWINPMIWLLHKELKLTHEYQADSATYERYPEYPKVISEISLGMPAFTLVNKFNSMSNLKKRLKMMNKSKKTKAVPRYLAFMGAVVFGLILVSWKSGNLEVPALTQQEDEEVYEKVDVMPEFPGGMDGLVKYMQTNIVYPEKAKKDGVEGKVFVSFVVNKNGKVGQAKVMKSENDLLNATALKVVKDMPEWTPGEKDGDKVNVKMVLPIVYKLPKVKSDQ